MHVSSLFTLLVLFLSLQLSAQTPQVTAFGEVGANYLGQQGIIDGNGNYVMAGKKFQTNDYPHIALFNQNMVYQWSFQLNKTSVTAMKIIETRDKNYVAAFATGASSVLVKFDMYGNIIWYRDYTNVHSFEDMVEDAASDIYLVGNNGNKMLLSKLNVSGNILWTAAYTMNPVSDYLFGKSIVESYDGKLILCGVASYLNGTKAKIVTVKADKTAGTILWASALSSTAGSMLIDRMIESQAPDHSLFGVGYVGAGATSTFEGLSVRLDSAGNHLSNRWVGYDFHDTYYDVAEAPEGGFVAVGMSKPVINCGGNLFFTRFDSNHDTVYQKVYGTAAGNGAFFFNLHNHNAGGYYTFGTGSLWSSIQIPYDYTYLHTDAQLELPCKKFSQPFYSDTLPITQAANVVKTTFTPTFTSSFEKTPDVMHAVDACTGQVLAVSSINETYNIQLLPNPASDLVNLRLPYEDRWQIRVYQSTGQCVYQTQCANTQLAIQTAGWASGLYLLTAKDQHGRSFQRKLNVAN